MEKNSLIQTLLIMENLPADVITSNITKKLELNDKYSFSLICKFMYDHVDYYDNYFYYPGNTKYLRNIIVTKNIDDNLKLQKYNNLKKIVLFCNKIPKFIPESVNEFTLFANVLSIPDSICDIKSVTIKSKTPTNFF